VYSFTVAYPLASLSPTSLSVQLYSQSSTTRTVTLSNFGNADLTWELMTAWVDVDSADEGAWSHAGANDQWHVSTLKAHSGEYAWYCGDDGTKNYTDLMDTSLVMPAVPMGADAMLCFWQWADMEPDGSFGYEDYYWDGGVVEISTNGGSSFESITPEGGYPYKITPNVDSPFPDHMPCIGGTGGWERVTFDLADYAGDTVQIRFRFGSDRYTTAGGWYIDDVELSWGAPWLQLPQSSGMVPPGTNSNIAIAFDSTGLPMGVFYSVVALVSNDPTQPILTLPVQLTVLGMPLTASIALAGYTSDTFVVNWPSTTGRTYSLMLSTNLLNGAAWTFIPGYTNLPGVEGVMSYTGLVDHIPAKFYRIEETRP